MNGNQKAERVETLEDLTPTQCLVLLAYYELEEKEPGRVWTVEEVTAQANEILARPVN